MDSLTNTYSVTNVERSHLVDAWGTITTPLGTHSTLRQKSSSTSIVDTYVFGMLVFSDTSGTVSFNWWTNDYGTIISVVADSVVEDSLVRTPSCYAITTYSSVSVEEEQHLHISRPFSVRALGNPTSLPLLIEMETDKSQESSIEIYDVSGRLIIRFEGVNPGLFRWSGVAHNGLRIPAGAYIVNVKTGSGAKSLVVSIM